MSQLNIWGRDKAEQAIEFIQANAPKDEPYMLCYSGGKDSEVLWDLAYQSGVEFVTYYSMMPDPPEILKHIKKYHPEVQILRPEYSFWRGIVKNFPPHRKARWCCRVIKEGPSTKVPLTHRLVGIRAEESPARARQGMINQITKSRINYHPLFNWLEWEIWEYIDARGLPYCSLYDEEFSRLGCVICPMRSTPEQAKYLERWPQYRKLFEKQVCKWWEQKGQFRENEPAKNCQEFLDRWYRGL